MRKFFAFAASLALIFSLSACNGGQDQGENVDTSPSPSNADSSDTENNLSLVSKENANAYTQALAGVDADTVMFTVNGEDVTAEYYFYWLSYDCYYWNFMSQMYSGVELDFDTEVEEGISTAEYLKGDAQQMAAAYLILEQQTAANQCGLTEEQRASWEEIKAGYEQDQIAQGEEDLTAFLKQLGLSEESFDRIGMMVETNYLFDNLSAALIPDPTDEEIDQYVAENDIYKAKHILICTAKENEDGTISLSTGAAPLNEDGTEFTGTAEEYNAQAKAKAEGLLEELNASDDPIALFDELMNANSEDTGLAANPDGYTFSSGEMVEPFENATKELDYQEYSGLVESDFGYHIILRLDVLEEYRSDRMNQMVSEWMDSAEIVTTEAYDNLDVKEFYSAYQAYQEALNPTPDNGDDAGDTAAPEDGDNAENTDTPNDGDAGTSDSASPANP